MAHEADGLAMKDRLPVLDGSLCHGRLGRHSDGWLHLLFLPAVREGFYVLDHRCALPLGDLLPSRHRGAPESMGDRDEKIRVGGQRILAWRGPELEDAACEVARSRIQEYSRRPIAITLCPVASDAPSLIDRFSQRQQFVFRLWTGSQRHPRG